eukprot:8622582-Prorocentrum_lima.AAC.1
MFATFVAKMLVFFFALAELPLDMLRLLREAGGKFIRRAKGRALTSQTEGKGVPRASFRNRGDVCFSEEG